ncbi:MAG: hypothetical protein FK732_06450 [Asgard group archaeon]|nr:hypothetical protein [Asgard group archaeon]
MRVRRKRDAILLVVICVTAINLHPTFKETKAFILDPFFTLDARGFTTRHMDYLHLMKVQLRRIGISLRLQLHNWFDVSFQKELIDFPDFDVQIMEIPNNISSDPFLLDFFTENGSCNYAGYETSIDWDDDLETGKNEWFIQTGYQMTPNDSQERINLCWEWQHYLLDEILPCLPLFTQKNNQSYFDVLFFNMREVRAETGSRSFTPLVPEKTVGLVVRKAISYAINREEIRRVVLGADYEVIHHPINPFMTEWLNPNSIQYCHDFSVAWYFMNVAGYDISCTYDFNGWDGWPDWRDVCNSNPNTINVTGFNLLLALGVLSVLSTAYYFIRRKKTKSSRVN